MKSILASNLNPHKSRKALFSMLFLNSIVVEYEVSSKNKNYNIYNV